MNIQELVNWRYATKEFDPNKKLSDSDLEQIKALLRMSPSSVNIQPWHFIITDTDAGKERITKATQGFYKFSEPKIKNASLVVIFCAKTEITEQYMQHLSDTENRDGRYKDEEFKQMVYNIRNTFTDMHRYEFKDFQHWIEKQVYLNMGSFLLGVASLGLDALPMEGLDFKILDQEFDLHRKGLTAVTAVAVGYRADIDFNTPDKTPKSRLAAAELFTEI